MTAGQQEYQMPDMLRDDAPRVSADVPSPTAFRRRRWPWILLAASILAVVCAILVFREPTEALTPERIEHARRLWQAAGIEDYDLRVRVRGTEADSSEYEVGVREGRVLRLLRSGQSADSHRPADFTVPGLFDTLEREFHLAHDPSTPFGAPGAQVLMRVRFNSRLGFVERYIRSVTGSRSSMEITTTSFRPTANRPSLSPE